MVLEEGDEAGEQAWIAQPRAVLRLRAAERDVVAASGPGGAAVEQVLLRVQPGVEGGVEDRLDRRPVLLEARGGRQVHLDDARIGRDGHPGEDRVRRRRIALEQNGLDEGATGLVDGGDQRQELLRRRDRRQEDAQRAAAGLDAERRPHGERRFACGWLERREQLLHDLRGDLALRDPAQQAGPLPFRLVSGSFGAARIGRLDRLLADRDGWRAAERCER